MRANVEADLEVRLRADLKVGLYVQETPVTALPLHAANISRMRAAAPIVQHLKAVALAAVTALAVALVAERVRRATPATAAQTTVNQAELLIVDGTVVTMNRDRHVLMNGAVAIRGADIVAVGESADLRRANTKARIIEAAGRIVLPGLINTHTHAPMVMYRGLADDLVLKDWLEQYIFPAEARTVSASFVRTGTQLAALEMIRSGTTTYADMYYFEEDIARATRDAGLRAILGQTVIGFPAPDAKTPAEALERTASFIASFTGDPLITPAVAPHSMYLVDRQTLLACRDFAVQHRVPLLIHLAETRAEITTSRERYQASPVEFLEQIGFWAPVTVAAHGVWMSDGDLAILKKRAVGVSHNPESNMKLASGVAPVPKYLSMGIPLGLGTDGAASNNDLDMFEAMRQAALLHKLNTGDPRAVPARAALEMATIGGARVLGLQDAVGSLEVGKRADVIIVDARKARQTPMYDPVSHLVYVTRGEDVETTIVHGRVLMENREVRSLDEEKVLAAARKAADDVRRAVRRENTAQP
jgi:5-methylthioadenosine/S-adenosylhomocysteine deaminase